MLPREKSAHDRRRCACDPHGEMVEWFKASVLKTDEGQPSGGSNPPLSAIFMFMLPFFFVFSILFVFFC